ncbi:hypothetical protein ACIA8B_13495 [Micromonospora chalcea]
MSGTTLWISLLGAAIGAGGAVAAQIVAASFTARRENERLAWEKDKQQQEWRLRRAEQFLDTKRELYSRYIGLLYNPTMALVELTHREYADVEGWHQRVPKYVGPLGDEIDRLRWDIRLLGSPVVYERVEFSNASLLVAISEAGRPDRSSLEKRHDLAKGATRAWQDVSNVMRFDLQGDEQALARRSAQIRERRRGPASVPPDEAPARSRRWTCVRPLSWLTRHRSHRLGSDEKA